MYYLGYDIGGTKCAVTLGEDSGGTMEILGKEKILTAGAPEDVLRRLSDAGMKLLSARGLTAKDVKSAGISCGGPISGSRGVILSPPNLPGWDEIYAPKIVTAYTGIPAFMENDANACALAEWKFGAGRGTRNMIFLTFGTGFGAGLILDGRLFRGSTESAGEIGHVRLTDEGPVGFRKAGSCEGWCSGGGIRRMALMMAEKDPAGAAVLMKAADGDPEKVNAGLIARLAENPPYDPFCLSVYEKSGEMLGRALAILNDLFDPDRIVIGSIFARSEGILRASMEKTLAAEALRVPEVVPAALGESLGDVAALSIAVLGEEIYK